MSITSLQELGATLISPMFNFYNQTLTDNLDEQEKIFFLAREGYWFSRAYTEFCKITGRADNSQYIKFEFEFINNKMRQNFIIVFCLFIVAGVLS